MKVGSGFARTGLCWGSVPDADIYRLARVASRNGFDEIAITAGHYLAALRAGADDAHLRKMLAAANIQVGIIDPLIGALPGLPRSETVKAEWRHFLEFTAADCFAAARALGARTINLAHFLGDPTISFGLLVDAVRNLAEEAKRRDVRLSIEFIPGTGIPSLADALEIIRLVDAPHVGVMFDTWHFLRSGGSVDELGQIGPGQIFELQLSDRMAPVPGAAYVPMSGRLAPGEGAAPIGEIVAALRRATTDLVICVEVFTAEAGPCEVVAKTLAEATRSFIKGLKAAE